ncbi:BTB/POZ domain and ankyrin repeat-containing protein NH5.1 [Dissostichus eleginoides]|uniref:BTB/POZ domain and ankyrin repeat-containing protein NH5.1 n=1 Tax=Dissostichus eleginoides TaxID=100907 RepID=A0AAD9F0Y8_DISEL|nr:BTB/POZ domain and ankyrin repeat-containing protein NH5.1 [Dissostichus eleginoides]
MAGISTATCFLVYRRDCGRRAAPVTTGGDDPGGGVGGQVPRSNCGASLVPVLRLHRAITFSSTMMDPTSARTTSTDVLWSRDTPHFA